MIEETIRTLLNTLAPTTPFAKADPSVRPRITFSRVVGVVFMHLGGMGPPRVQFQIDVWADDLLDARGLAEQAKVALEQGLTVGAFQDNPDDFEESTKLNRASFDVAVW